MIGSPSTIRSTRATSAFADGGVALAPQRETSRPFDSLHDYRAYRSNPVIHLDPLGLQATTQPTTQPGGSATVDLDINTGSNNAKSPWIGAAWTLYRGVPGDKGNPGLVRPGLPTVKCSCDDCGGITCSVSFSLQMGLRNTGEKPVIQNVDGKRVLTDYGRQVYGHEQMHIKDYVTQARGLVNGIAQNTPNGGSVADCKNRAADLERQLRKAVRDSLGARRPGGKGPDVTDGGPGQPISGVGYDPEGEPGSWVPHF